MDRQSIKVLETTNYSTIRATVPLKFRQNNRLRYRVNNITHSNGYSGQTSFQDDIRYGISRDDSANQELLIDGAQVHTEADTSTALPTIPLYLGASNIDSVSSLFLNARASHFIAGTGFDLTALKIELDLMESEFIV